MTKATKENKQETSEVLESVENKVKLSDIAKDYDIKSSIVRVWLRNSEIEKPGSRWEWEENDDRIEEVEALIEEKLEKKEERAKAKSEEDLEEDVNDEEDEDEDEDDDI